MKHKPKLWTKTGLTKLGRLIRYNRESQGLTLVTAAALIKERTGESIGFRTLSTIETSAGEPRYNTLATVAAAGFVKKNGKVLDIWDFINIASETYVNNMNCLSELIENYLAIHSTTLEQFSKICGVTTQDLMAIAQGRETADYEGDLILLSRHLYNPDTGTNFNNYPEMMEYLRCDSGKREENHTIKSKLLY